MPHVASVEIKVLKTEDVAVMEGMLALFGEAFAEPEIYGGARPGERYLRRLLGSETFIALAAVESAIVVGALAAYELKKFERERSEIYIYDLAVAEPHRRKGIATALIEKLKSIAAARGAYVIFVQADLVDEPRWRSIQSWASARRFCTSILRSISGQKNTRDHCWPRVFPPLIGRVVGLSNRDDWRHCS
jgi:aminoglycoside 3-N-acetyltransferase I